MSDYRYDVFISLSHSGQWMTWLEDRFLERFSHYVSTELADRPRTYIARHEMQAGDSWPDELATSLAKSKTLLAICTFPYRQRPWCQLEFSMMRAREDSLGLRRSGLGGLIVPVIAHDCEDAPSFLDGIETIDIKGLTYLDLCPRSPKAERLEEKIEAIGIAVAKAVRGAPHYRPEWQVESCDAFRKQFEDHSADKLKRNPRFF